MFQVRAKFQREYSITMLVESIKLLKQPPTCTFINEEIISCVYDAHITATYTVKTWVNKYMTVIYEEKLN